MMLLLDLFSVRGSPRLFAPSWPSLPPSSSLAISPRLLNHPIPSSYGLAIGEPFTLSMLSSRRGNRVAGYAGVFGGNVGLNVELDGTRCCCRLGLGTGYLTGDVGRDGGREPYVEVALL